MGLVQMHTAGSRFSPQIGNCIQANNICPMTYIHEQNLDNTHQDIRVSIVEIYLIV